MESDRYDVRLSVDGRYIIVEFHGDFDYRIRPRVYEQIVQIVKATGVKRVLYDMREGRNIGGFLGHVKHARPTSLPFYEELKGLRRVVLADPGDRSFEMAVLAFKRQGIDIEATRDEEYALKLLFRDEE